MSGWVDGQLGDWMNERVDDWMDGLSVNKMLADYDWLEYLLDFT